MASLPTLPPTQDQTLIPTSVTDLQYVKYQLWPLMCHSFLGEVIFDHQCLLDWQSVRSVTLYSLRVDRSWLQACTIQGHQLGELFP